MLETLKTVLIIFLILVCIILTYFLIDEQNNRDQYMKDRLSMLDRKHNELNSRERSLVGREMCDRDLTRLKTIHRSALDVMKQYTNTDQQSVY